MKLATYKDGSRDGQLVVVSRDLSTAHYATGRADRLQQVLDDWNFISPQLQDLSDTLNFGKARHAFAFDPAQCMAPLPRAYQRVGSAAFVPGSTEPLLYQGSSDDLRGACDDIVCASEALGVDFEGEIAVVTGDIAQGATPAQALDGVRLVMLANAVSLRSLMATELARGWGALQSRPSSAFSPVAVTLDELTFGSDNTWQQGRVHLTLQTTWNGRKVGLCEAGPEMTFDFGQLLAHLAKTRAVRAGSIVSSGAVINRDPSHGYSCIADKRALETLQDGKPLTGFMKYGDTLRLDMRGRDGQSVFGAIEQELVPLAEQLTPRQFA
jgi:fumarylacetoacetate (FAA) hydrolase